MPRYWTSSGMAAGAGAWRVADGKREAIQSRPHQEGIPWRVVGSRNHLSQATLDYLAGFGDMARGEIELVSMGSSLKFCIIAEGGRALSAPRSHLRVGYRCGAGGAGGRAAASPSSMACRCATTSRTSSTPGSWPRHKTGYWDTKGRTSMNCQSGLLFSMRVGSEDLLERLDGHLGIDTYRHIGSASAQALASACEANSAMTVLPVKPASTGSSASMAGLGPAVSSRPSSCSACSLARWAGRACAAAAGCPGHLRNR